MEVKSTDKKIISKEKIRGRVHSIQSFGTLDGPGLRTVIFFQGCPLHCKFCHNVDMTFKDGGKEYTVEELRDEVLKYKEYWQPSGSSSRKGITGGITLSGGEPTYQSRFLVPFLKELRAQNVHVAIDTCFGTAKLIVDKLSDKVDYWMVSIKHMDSDKHHDLTGVFNEHILENVKYLDKLLADSSNSTTESIEPAKRLRIRFLVIPGITDSEDHLTKLAEFIKQLKSLDVVEVLAYGKHGKYKWIESFGDYPLEGIPDATREDVERVKSFLQRLEINVMG